MTIGQTLPNGAVVRAAFRLATGELIVLCFWNDNPQKFVVWRATPDGQTYWGHYADTWERGIELFAERIQLLA